MYKRCCCYAVVVEAVLTAADVALVLVGVVALLLQRVFYCVGNMSAL